MLPYWASQTVHGKPAFITAADTNDDFQAHRRKRQQDKRQTLRLKTKPLIASCKSHLSVVLITNCHVCTTCPSRQLSAHGRRYVWQLSAQCVSRARHVHGSIGRATPHTSQTGADILLTKVRWMDACSARIEISYVSAWGADSQDRDSAKCSNLEVSMSRASALEYPHNASQGCKSPGCTTPPSRYMIVHPRP